MVVNPSTCDELRRGFVHHAQGLGRLPCRLHGLLAARPLATGQLRVESACATGPPDGRWTNRTPSAYSHPLLWLRVSDDYTTPRFHRVCHPMQWLLTFPPLCHQSGLLRSGWAAEAASAASWCQSPVVPPFLKYPRCLPSDGSRDHWRHARGFVTAGPYPKSLLGSGRVQRTEVFVSRSDKIK